jgi:hypothetical protein
MVSNNFSTISLNVSEAKPLYHSLSHNYLVIKLINNHFSNIREAYIRTEDAVQVEITGNTN